MYDTMILRPISIFIGFLNYFKIIYCIIQKHVIMENLGIPWNVLSYLRLFCKIIYGF